MIRGSILQTLGALLLGGVINCAPTPPNHYDVYIDPAFGDDVPIVENAISDWENRTNNILSTTVHVEWKWCAQACENIITIHPTTAQQIYDDRNQQDILGVTFGLFYNNSSNVLVDTLSAIENYKSDHYMTYPQTELWVMRHELGHGLGLVHTGKGTLMCYLNSCASSEITCADVKQYADLRSISIPCQE